MSGFLGKNALVLLCPAWMFVQRKICIGEPNCDISRIEISANNLKIIRNMREIEREAHVGGSKFEKLITLLSLNQ